MTEPAVDDAKRYLAGLHEEEEGKESQIAHSLSFDFTLAEWKSRTQLNQTAPMQALNDRNEMVDDAETPEIIPPPPTAPIPPSMSPPEPATPAPVKRRTHKLFFNFNKSKCKTISPASDDNSLKKCIKPTLYTLSE